MKIKFSQYRPNTFSIVFDVDMWTWLQLEALNVDNHYLDEEVLATESFIQSFDQQFILRTVKTIVIHPNETVDGSTCLITKNIINLKTKN